MTDITQAITKVARKQGVRAEAIEDFIARKAEFTHDITGRLVHVPTNQSAKKLFRKTIEANPQVRDPNAPARKPDPKSDNPWSLPPGPEGDAERARYVKQFGTQKAIAMARTLQVDLAGRPLQRKG